MDDNADPPEVLRMRRQRKGRKEKKAVYTKSGETGQTHFLGNVAASRRAAGRAAWDLAGTYPRLPGSWEREVGQRENMGPSGKLTVGRNAGKDQPEDKHRGRESPGRRRSTAGWARWSLRSIPPLSSPRCDVTMNLVIIIVFIVFLSV